MKIAFDATSAAFEKKTGTGVYTVEIIKAFEKTFPKDSFFHTYRLSRRLRGRQYTLPLSPSSHCHTIIDPFTFWRGPQYDIFHGLNARLPILAGTPRVVTIHDIFSLTGQYSKTEFIEDQKLKYSKTFAMADHIITPAQFTKKQMVSKLGADEKKITVVGEGVRERFLESFDKTKEKEKIKTTYGISKPFFLYVGTLEKRKNVVNIIKAFKSFDAASPGSHLLVLVGGQGFGYDDIQREIETFPGKEKIICLGFLEEEALASFYRCCEAFLFLSLEEGYGIPVIESMACGAPVISSNTTSLPEVGGGFSFLFNPEDISGVTKLLLEIKRGSDTIINQAKLGQSYALALTWGRVARQLRDVYQDVITRYRNP